MLNTDFLHSDKVAALAAGRVQSKIAYGAQAASGDITFAGQPTADDTVTVNGVVYTAKTAAAAATEFTIGADLTTTITNLVTKLNASTNPALTVATYSNVGGTKLHVAYDAVGVEGNDFTLAASVATPSAATLTGGSSPDKLEGAQTFALVTLAGTLAQFDLPNGDEGQEVTVYLKTKGTGANAQVNGAFSGGTKITLDTAGEYFYAKFLNGAWVALNNTGTLA